MITLIYREGVHVGSFRSNFHITQWGSLPLNCWFCSTCGRIWAREEVILEDKENESTCPHLYFVIARQCGGPLFLIDREDEIIWKCADKDLLSTVMKEHTYDNSKCVASQTSDPTRDSGVKRELGIIRGTLDTWRDTHFPDWRQYPTIF